jgi:hypothetical protein
VAGTQRRADFDHAIDGIRNVLGAEPMFKLMPNTRDTVSNDKSSAVFCPPLNNLAVNLPYSKAIIKEAGPKIRIYESSNEIEFDCAEQWGFSDAGSAGLGTVIAKHYGANMPALKKYARSLGFEIISVAYMGTAGGPGWGDSIAKPRVRTCTEFMTELHNEYVAHGNDPDYIPDAMSYHAYPYGGDFEFSTPLPDVIAYYKAVDAAWRAECVRIWGQGIGSKIRLVCSEWNAGGYNSDYKWPGFSDQRIDNFYTAWLGMLKSEHYWAADQFAVGSNTSQPYDLITPGGVVRRQYYPFKAASLAR